MSVYTDQLGREVIIPKTPKRIVSLVPSQTELLYDLGLEEEVVGLTKFCIHPEHWRKTKKVIGGTKKFHFDKIKELQPDLVIANKEENTLEGVETISQFAPVWVSDISDLNSALEMIESIGEICDRRKESSKLSIEIQGAFEQLNFAKFKKAVYLIWKNPYMAAGSDTFINQMMKQAGFENLVHAKRYPELTFEGITKLKPEVVLLSSEPYPFKERDLVEIQKELNCEVKLVDGELFSWYGSRLLRSPEYFKDIR